MLASTRTGRRKHTRTEQPPVLPDHLTPLGEQRRLSGSQGRYWIGLARATPDELRHIQGLVIYTRRAHLFLKVEEAREALSAAGPLLASLSDQGGNTR